MRTNTPLPLIMQNLNLYLCESLAEGTFVTMLAVLLDPATGELETINAGHPPGFFVTCKGEVSLTLAEADMPLGLDPEGQLLSEKATLEPETFLMMYTDGLTELPLEGGALLGEEALSTNLARLVTTTPNFAAADVCKKMNALLDSLQSGMSQDDRTFLIARRHA